MSDYALQRLNMVESQVRPSDLTDRRIARAMLAMPREQFVPQSVRSFCYTDRDLPLLAGNGAGDLAGDGAGDGAGVQRYLLAPRVQAKLIQVLDAPETGIVLDIGCGLGYSTAILSRLAETVVGIETDPDMIETARGLFAENEITNASVFQGLLTDGYDEQGPYDCILLNGAVSDVPPSLLDQLKDGGRLAAILHEGAVGRATEWTRHGGQFAKRAVFDAEAPTLPGFEKVETFVF